MVALCILIFNAFCKQFLENKIDRKTQHQKLYNLQKDALQIIADFIFETSASFTDRTS